MIDNIIRNKRFNRAMLYTYIFGIMAYAVVFVNPYYVHDHWKIASPMTMDLFLSGIGGSRWFSGFTTIATFGVVLPWLSGLIGLAFIGASVFFVVETLNIKSEIGILLVSGMMTVNRTLVFSNLYGGLHDFTIALFFACFSAYYMARCDSKKSLIFAVLGITMSLATYGVYVAVAIVLVAFDIFSRLLDGEGSIKLFKKTGLYISITSVGFVIYYIILRVLMKLTNNSLYPIQGREKLGSVHETTKGVLSVIPQSYKLSIKYYLEQGRSVFPPVLNILIISFAVALVAIIVIKQLKNQRIGVLQLIYLGVIVIIMPFLLGLPNILSMGNMHVLMDYVYVIPYVFAVVIAEKSLEIVTPPPKKNAMVVVMKKTVMVLIAFTVYYATVFANAAYTHLDNMYMTSISIGTRILDRIETVEGSTGDEPVILIGELDGRKYLTNMRYRDKVLDILNNDYTGACYLSKDVNTVFTEQGFTYEFLRNALGSNREIIAVYSTDELKGLSKSNSQEKIDIYNRLDSFPSEKCISKVGNIIFIKLGDLPY